MSGPIPIWDIVMRIAEDPSDNIGQILRQCPFIQAELLKRKSISLDDLTDEQLERLVEWDAKENPTIKDKCNGDKDNQ